MTNVKHIEVQILGDKKGNIVALGTRDCSVQRRYQKLIEEAPAMLPPYLLNKIEQTAIDIVSLVDYVCASTVEFLLDDQGNYYFMEVNPRLQVEHCVTEEIYNLDIVEQQIKIASEGLLDSKLEDINPQGHSIQCRINAENPSNNFLPNPGILNQFNPPVQKNSSIRFESFLKPEMIIPSLYDSLVAKLIITGKNRPQTIKQMDQELSKIIIRGFPTTIPFTRAILQEKTFQQGTHKTNYIDLFLPDLLKNISE